MKAVRRTKDGRVAIFQEGERAVLAQLVAALVEIVADLLPDSDDELSSIFGNDVTADEVYERDPALQRLFPVAYPDDPAADVEFRRYTEADAARAKIDAAVVVWNNLRDSDRVTIADADFASWIKTLANIRLVLSERDDADLEDIYEWTGWVLESLLAS